MRRLGSTKLGLFRTSVMLFIHIFIPVVTVIWSNLNHAFVWCLLYFILKRYHSVCCPSTYSIHHIMPILFLMSSVCFLLCSTLISYQNVSTYSEHSLVLQLAGPDKKLTWWLWWTARAQGKRTPRSRWISLSTWPAPWMSVKRRSRSAWFSPRNASHRLNPSGTLQSTILIWGQVLVSATHIVWMYDWVQGNLTWL